MACEPVSIIHWHDANENPPTKAGLYLVNDPIDGVTEGYFNPLREPYQWVYDGSRSHPTHWAHIPNIGALHAHLWSPQPDKPEASIIEWHRLPDKPNEGEMVILEIEGKRGRSNIVGVAECREIRGLPAGWAFEDTRGAMDLSVPDDRVVRWARFPEPSWKEVIE